MVTYTNPPPKKKQLCNHRVQLKNGFNLLTICLLSTPKTFKYPDFATVIQKKYILIKILMLSNALSLNKDLHILPYSIS